MSLSSRIAPSAIAKPGVIANAAARPASPYQGQVVYQLDTNGIYAWNGSSWTLPWNMPWGAVSRTSYTSDQGSITTEVDVTGSSQTFTAVANRLYKLSFQASYFSTVAGNMPLVRFKDGSTQIGYFQLFTAQTSAYSTMVNCHLVTTFSAGSHTIKATIATFTGSGNGNLQGSVTATTLLIEDIGPA